MDHESSENITIPTFWPLEHDLPSLPANQFAVSRSEDFIYLVFGELRPLILKEPSEEQVAQIREHGVLIKPVASIAVTPGGYLKLTNLLVNILNTDELAGLAEHIQNILDKRGGK
jgi:hypothetical protein